MPGARAMDELVRSRIRMSVSLLDRGSPPVPGKVFKLAESIGVVRFFGDGALTPNPIIYPGEVPLRLNCVQKEFFGFYVLREAIGRTLAAVNFQVAGDLLVSQELYAPSAVLFYTSAYHALHGYLAAKGRVFLEEDRFRWLGDEAKTPSLLAACLNSKGRWSFEGRRRNHSVRWSELKNVFGRRGFEIPKYFHHLFYSILPGLGRPGFTNLECVKNPVNTRARLEDNLDLFLDRITSIRYRAIYRGSGEDPSVVEALANQDAFSEDGIDRQARALGVFSHGLLGDSARLVRDFLPCANSLRPAHRVLLFLGTELPWGQDRPRIDQWLNRRVRHDIEEIYSWVRPPAGAREDLTRILLESGQSRRQAQGKARKRN